MSALSRDHECWSYVRPAQRTRDGRVAFFGLKGHYLGINNVDNMSAEAEKKLSTTTYAGEQRRWNFEKYVKVHVDQHAILQGLVEHGYSGIDERSKVRHLLAGIKSAALDPVKTRILSDANLRSDFSACVILYKDFIMQVNAASNVRESRVAATMSDKGKGTSSEENIDMSVEDRYYNKKEYASLSAAQRNALRLKRAKRGHKSSSKTPTPKNQKRQRSNTSHLSKRMIKAIKAVMKNEDKDDCSSSSETEQTSNRTNPALQRKS